MPLDTESKSVEPRSKNGALSLDAPAPGTAMALEKLVSLAGHSAAHYGYGSTRRMTLPAGSGQMMRLASFNQSPSC